MEVYFINGDAKVHVKDNLSNLPKDKFVWVRLISPTKEEIDVVSKFSNVPVEEFKDFIEDEEERPRIESKRYLQIIYQAPIIEKGEVITEAVTMFIYKNIVVTTERERVVPIEKITKLLRNNALKFIIKSGPGRLTTMILDKINDDFFNRIEKIARVTKISRSEDIDVQQKILIKLYNSNVTLSHFNQAMIGNLEIMNQLRKVPFKQFINKDREEFSDLYYDVLQLIDTLKIQRDTNTTIFNFQTVLSSYKLNNYMKQLTSLALIMLVPTFIASMYGMNVPLPFQGTKYAFWAVVLIMLAVTVGLYFFFKKIDLI